MKKLLLKYNARLKDKLPEIRELVEKHHLEIESVEDVHESTKWFKLIRVRGELQKLQALDRELYRHASITKKAA